MKRTIFFSIALAAFLSFSFQCSTPPPLATITVINTSDYDLNKSSVEVELSQLRLTSDVENQNFVLRAGDVEIPYQLDDLDKDGKKDVLFFQIDINSQDKQEITLVKTDTPQSFVKLTNGVLKVREKPDPNSMQVGDDFIPTTSYEIPADLAQDNGLVFLEGPAWESNLIGYRFYLDNRTRFDIFGKTTQDLVLNDISGNYHEIGDWGADVLSVGASLGMGSPAVIARDQIRTIDKVQSKDIEIIVNGPLRTIIRTSYKQWDIPGKAIDITMDLEIHAHQRYTKLTLLHDALPTEARLATGLVRNAVAPDFTEGKIGDMHFISNWGSNASYHEKPLGKALLVKNTFNPKSDGTNDLSYLVNLESNLNQVEYYFLAAWGLEPERSRIATEKEFKDHVEQLASQLSSPLKVSAKVH